MTDPAATWRLDTFKSIDRLLEDYPKVDHAMMRLDLFRLVCDQTSLFIESYRPDLTPPVR